MTIRRVYVSSTGDDQDAGTRAAPCRTFAGALPKVDDGGIIRCLDDEDYGPVTIDKSVTIDARDGGAIEVSNANAINITAGPTKTVRLRGLHTTGLSDLGLIGINATGGAALEIDGGPIRGFRTGSAIGVNYAPPDGVIGKLKLRNLSVDNCGNTEFNGGVLVKPNLTGGALVAVENCWFSGNTSALIADGNGNTGGINVFVDEQCLFAGNSWHAIYANSASAFSVTNVHAVGAAIFGNGSSSGQAAVRVNETKAYFVSSRCYIGRNWYGVWRSNAGNWISFGDNIVQGLNISGTDAPSSTGSKS